MLLSGALAERLSEVRGGIAESARFAGRSAEDITLIVVTKYHPVSMVAELADLCVRDFGESRHQEAVAKAAELADRDLNWHFVGQLQTNKARHVREYASTIHVVDRPRLAAALANEQMSIDCFVQVNLTDDPGRGGAEPARLEPLVTSVLSTPGLRLLGVMAVAPRDQEPRRAFEYTRSLSERVRALAPTATALSMGMSADYRDAIAEGATHLRIGAAITGNREHTP